MAIFLSGKNGELFCNLELVAGGDHGWDDSSPDPKGYKEGRFPDMRTIFFASGPAFKKGHSHTWIKLVDEYQVFLHVLGIKGESHNGTWNRVKGMFPS